MSLKIELYVSLMDFLSHAFEFQGRPCLSNQISRLLWTPFQSKSYDLGPGKATEIDMM